MLRIPDCDLAEPAALRLRRYQDEIDAVATYPERVAAGKDKFKSHNREGDPVFGDVRRKLREMCFGLERCMYCEDSGADEIEHFKPKDLYPERVFVWPNLLYSCGSCNGTKRNRFLVFSTDGDVIDVTRRRNAEVRPPPTGVPVLINPRHEDPLKLLQLDLRDTFFFRPRARHGTHAYERADRTRRILNLNDRHLPAARRGAFEAFKAMLQRYVDGNRSGASPMALDRIRTAIANNPHPTVWAEIKRQRQHLADITALFDSVPEALAW